MEAPITLLEIKDAKTLKLVNLLVEHLRSINNKYFHILTNGRTKALTEDNTRILSSIFPQHVETPSNYSTVDLNELIEALQADISSMSSIFLDRFSKQYSFYLRSYNKTSKKFKIFPEKQDKRDSEAIIVGTFYQLNLWIDNCLTDQLPSEDSLTELDTKFSHINTCYNEKMGDIWREIEKLDKFRNDHGRYWFAKSAFWISIILIITGQIHDIFENIVWVLSKINSLF